jgi:hypothetical protein
MGNGNFACEIVQSDDKRQCRAEIYELPDRVLVGVGPWEDTAKKARLAACIRLREMLCAAECIFI